MIIDKKLWEEFEAEWHKENKPTYEENMRKFLYMLEINKSVKNRYKRDLLEGIDVKIRISKILNSL